MSALAFAMYEITHEFIKEITQAISNVKLIIIGGI